MSNEPQQSIGASKLMMFENFTIRHLYNEEKDMWFFSVIDIVQALLQKDYQTARKYWKVLKNRLQKEGSQVVTKCYQLKTDYWSTHDVKEGQEYAILTNLIHQQWSGISVKQHKVIKGLKTQNLRDHMSEAELIFTALAELSTREIAESMKATGLDENVLAGKSGGSIARKARHELETKTGKSVVTRENFLPPRKKLLPSDTQQ